MTHVAPDVAPFDKVRVKPDPTDPHAVLLYLPEFTYLDTQAGAVEIGVPKGLLAELVAVLAKEAA